MAVLVKGSHVKFEVLGLGSAKFEIDEKGRRIYSCPDSHGMVHDPEGISYPRCEVYVGPYEKTGERVEMDKFGKDYFGANYNANAAIVNVPRSGWKFLDESVQIFYKRPAGDKKAIHEGFYFHPMKIPVRLSRSGHFIRIDLPDGCVVNERGFVYP